MTMNVAPVSRAATTVVIIVENFNVDILIPYNEWFTPFVLEEFGLN